MQGDPSDVASTSPKGLNLVIGVVSVSAAVGFAMAVWIGVSEGDNPSPAGYREAVSTAGSLGMLAAILIIGNIGLYRRRRWARILIVVLGTSGAFWTGLFSVAVFSAAVEGPSEILPTWLLAWGFVAAFVLCSSTVYWLLSAQGRSAFPVSADRTLDRRNQVSG